MPTLSSMRIPPPLSWDEFEEISLDACKVKWENPDLQKNGRQGQPQNGVDIFGANHLYQNIGVQCKNYEKTLTISTINEEIEKAETFQPKIQMFYIATTTKTDATIQREVRLISQSRSLKGEFPVMILFWEDIKQELVKNHAVFRKHYPDLSLPVNLINSIPDIKSYSILDLVYSTLNLDFHNELIFGELGEMAGEDPLQIQSQILTIKYSSSNVLNEGDYSQMSTLIKKYKDYLFSTEERREKFNWDTARQISNEFTGIVEGVQYNLTKKELAVFNIGKLLTRWTRWESEKDVAWPIKSWEVLIDLGSQIESEELSQILKDLEVDYNEGDQWVKLRHPHTVYNAIRSTLMRISE